MHTLLHSSSSTPPETNKNKQGKFDSKNRYGPIAPDDNTNSEITSYQSTINNETDEIHRTPSPPPIFVNNVDNFINLRTDLVNLIGTQNLSFKSTINNLKITTKDSDAYRKIIRHLKVKQIEHHTYEAHEDRAFRIIVRNLHPSTPTTEIGISVSETGYRVHNVKTSYTRPQNNHYQYFSLILTLQKLTKKFSN